MYCYGDQFLSGWLASVGFSNISGIDPRFEWWLKNAPKQNLQIEASIEDDNPENLFSPADAKFFHMFAQGKDIAVGDLDVA